MNSDMIQKEKAATFISYMSSFKIFLAIFMFSDFQNLD